MARTPEDSISTSEKFRMRIHELMEEQDCDKTDFAAYVGVNKGVILYATKYGIIPSVKSLLKIADVLQYSINYILGETDEKDFTPSNHPTTFHIRLEELTQQKQMTYSQITKLMPFAANSIYEWNRKKCLPSLDYLKALAEYFKVSIDYLLGRTDDRN